MGRFLLIISLLLALFTPALAESCAEMACCQETAIEMTCCESMAECECVLQESTPEPDAPVAGTHTETEIESLELCLLEWPEEPVRAAAQRPQWPAVEPVPIRAETILSPRLLANPPPPIS